MDFINYDLTLLVIGLSIFALTLLWEFINTTFISHAVGFILIGFVVVLLLPDLPSVDPIQNGILTERLSEMAVIISLTGVGLKLNRPLGWRSWQSTWRLLAITMPVSILLLVIGGVWIAGLPIAAAVLLGAVIAPTDPVLADGVQVREIGGKNESEVRFALTSEAALNDGLAFPFVNLAVVLAATGFASEGLMYWLGIDVFWKIASGLGMGWFIGYGIAYCVKRFIKNELFSRGYIAIALTLFSYGATELINGYGFIGVFVAAYVFSYYKPNVELHKKLYEFVHQAEVLFMIVLMILLGMAIGQGLLGVLTLPLVLLSLGFLFIMRPIAGMVGLIGKKINLDQKLKISWFGIRGVGTIYYLSYGLNNAAISDEHARIIWAIAGLIVLISVILHGISAHFIMRDKKQPIS